ncbi:MAG: radical SAM protein [Planctomycetota bacterium]|jgi:predicted DNA-binding helix-hairpin-helix protein
MDLSKRMKILGRSARFDLCGDCDVKGTGRVRAAGDRWHYPELVPDGKNSIMLRVLMSNRCENNCFYCENAAKRDFRKASLTPDEIASHFAGLFRADKARSLFLSSAVRHSTESTMTRMVETLELLRFKHRIPAYIHAKILPGASDSVIERAVRLATRVSVNLEVPNAERMRAIGAPKHFEKDLYGRVRFIRRLLENPALAKKTQTTQFVVGASGETDQELLAAMSHLYKDLNLARIYFSAFQTPGRVDFGAPRAPLLREHRLYQADFLLRKYGFKAEEIPLAEDRQLLLHEDPKTRWARLHPEFFPLEINSAPRSALLRVPGLGPISVRRILKARKEGKIHSKNHLKTLGIRPKPALDYLLFNGVYLGQKDRDMGKQITLFSA